MDDPFNFQIDNSPQGVLYNDANDSGLTFISGNGSDYNGAVLGGGGGEPVSSGPTPEQIAEQNRIAGLQHQFDTQKQGIYSTALERADSLGSGYGQSILDAIHNLTLGQQGIDRQRTQNEASRIQGGRGILDMIGRGIKSAGVMLAGRNAGNSSATRAIGNAYGDLGRRQMSSIGNQYALKNQSIDDAQTEQNWQLTRTPEKFKESLNQDVNNLVLSAREQFARLDAAMADASLPDRIAIDQEKENLRSQVLAKLQQYDAQLRSGVAGIAPASREQNLTSAQEMLQMGQAPANMFQYTDQAPLQVQNSGPVASSLPLFTLGKRQLQV